ncbi:hypothetical protein GCM10022207_50110 [Streptomyces lannensis]|uniref:Integral membrane protein n=1 Tax=Streptomyces lannensis TaxID=766498 RepID=A0ABP7KK42_9ACTN
MPLVPGVPVSVVQVVDVVAVLDRAMAAALAVPVLVVAGVGDMAARLALVPVAAVLAVQMAVVRVVDVVPVRYGLVAAGRAVAVIVSGVFPVEGVHDARLRRVLCGDGSG